jgi:hypothetical protein
MNEVGYTYSTPPAAQPAPVQEPVWIQPDHLQKAQKAPFLCRVEPHKRDDFVPLYPTPPAAQRPDVDALVALARADEREACAQIAWNMEPDENGPIEAAIRARGETK